MVGGRVGHLSMAQWELGRRNWGWHKVYSVVVCSLGTFAVLLSFLFKNPRLLGVVTSLEEVCASKVNLSIFNPGLSPALPAQSVPNCICPCHFTSLPFPILSPLVSLCLFYCLLFFLSFFSLLLPPKTSNRLGWEKEGMFRIKKEIPPEHAHWSLGEKMWALLRAPFKQLSSFH